MKAPALDPIEQRKMRGAFYTPGHLTHALTEWAIRGPHDRVLDPAAGDAAFLLAAHQVLKARGSLRPARQLVGVELDALAREEALGRLARVGRGARVERADFFAIEPSDVDGGCDAVVGNPPYVRYHRFRGEARALAMRRAAEQGVRLSALTSSWAPFVVHASLFVRPGGRMALVLPAELLQVDYAQPVREFLLRRFGAVTVVCFDKAIFPDAQIDAVVLLAEDCASNKGVRLLTRTAPLRIQEISSAPFHHAPPPRWSYLRAPGKGPAALAGLKRTGDVQPFGAVASVDIGSVTGANDFFLLSRTEAKQLGVAPALLVPAVGRPAQLAGATVRSADFRAMAPSDKHLLLVLREVGLSNRATALGRYLERGQAAGFANRYKCRVRTPWYAVPGVRRPDAFLSYMSHRSPRIALNLASATSTNLVHQIVFQASARADAAAYVAALHSSASQLSFELEGRSYGGGVLKLETREAQRVLIPVLDARSVRALTDCLGEVDAALRQRDAQKATEVVDQALVAHGVMNTTQVRHMRSSTEALRIRRLERNRKSS